MVHDELVSVERILLGCLLLEGEDRFSELLGSGLAIDDFNSRSHQIVFSAAHHLHQQGSEIDVILVADRLKAVGQLDTVGGYPFLNDLVQGIPHIDNIHYYLNIVKEKARRRSLVAIGRELSQSANDNDRTINEILDHALAKLQAVSEAQTQDSFQSSEDLRKVVYDDLLLQAKHPERAWGVKSGFERIDETYHGFQPGDLIILAARPSMGKTAMALTMAESMATHRPGVAFFTLEMSSTQLMKRLLSIHTGVPLTSILKGGMASEEWRRLEIEMDSKARQIYWCESDSYTVSRIRLKLNQLARLHPLSAVVIDYLQLMQSDEHGTGRSVQNRTQEISAITRGLKILAKDFGIPVLLLSQLSRKPEEAKDHRPQLSHLRESGSIEQDADVVWFIYREDYYEARRAGREEADLQTTELIVAKHRNGPTGTFKLAFKKHLTKFLELGTAQPGAR